jgi:glucose-6-phosphate isomerase
LKQKISAALKADASTAFTAESLATKIGAADQTELVFKVLEHLAANGGARKTAKKVWHESTYQSA